MGALLLIDLQELRKDPGLLGKVLARVRYGRLGTLSIYLITRGESIREWAETVRDSLSKNFDVTVYLYALDNIDKAIKKITDSCRNEDVVFIYKEASEELLNSIKAVCNNIEVL
ncbi:hypothetical protein ATG_06930 [Desulfurococcaceae archaeon AG1]|nr:hypothetical protein ATG_06930 [Desulfurococcaceae archaeon AG1]